MYSFDDSFLFDFQAVTSTSATHNDRASSPSSESMSSASKTPDGETNTVEKDDSVDEGGNIESVASCPIAASSSSPVDSDPSPSSIEETTKDVKKSAESTTDRHPASDNTSDLTNAKDTRTENSVVGKDDCEPSVDKTKTEPIHKTEADIKSEVNAIPAESSIMEESKDNDLKKEVLVKNEAKCPNESKPSCSSSTDVKPNSRCKLLVDDFFKSKEFQDKIKEVIKG